jgi:hypothetical protein
MKKNLILLTALLSSAVSFAQQRAHTFAITPKVGVNVSSLKNLNGAVYYAVGNPYSGGTGISTSTGNDYLAGSFISAKSKANVGFTAGVEGQYQFTDLFGLSVGAFYAREGCHYDTKGLTITDGKESYNISLTNNLRANLDCITIPVLANVYVWRGLAVKAGLQPEIIVHKSGSVDARVSANDVSTGLGIDADPNLHSFSLSLPVGLSYEYKNVVLDARYCFGLTNIENNRDPELGNDKVHLNTFSVTLGYKFEL